MAIGWDWAKEEEVKEKKEKEKKDDSLLDEWGNL